MKTVQTRLFRWGIVFALILTCISIFRDHSHDFGKSGWEVLRPEDKELVIMSKGVSKDRPTTVHRHDVAFAEFPLIVDNPDDILVLQY